MDSTGEGGCLMCMRTEVAGNGATPCSLERDLNLEGQFTRMKLAYVPFYPAYLPLKDLMDPCQLINSLAL